MEALQQHQQLCDELHELALEENRFLQQNRRAPDAPLLDRKRALLARLDEALNALRGASRDKADTALKQALEKTRTRILQILQLDRENEQLLLRYSLTGGQPARAPSAPTAAPSMLQKIYQRHS
ncbi:MAG TPA: hypothetical protein VFJ90_03205 [Candidatus Didemnitutus sp.]|nr:hypothetical protein [Candidatus Didemnitutus sp.]